MTVDELIAALYTIRAQVPRGSEVALWDQDGGNLTMDLSVDYDRFEPDGPWFVLIERPGDPGRKLS